MNEVWFYVTLPFEILWVLLRALPYFVLGYGGLFLAWQAHEWWIHRRT